MAGLVELKAGLAQLPPERRLVKAEEYAALVAEEGTSQSSIRLASYDMLRVEASLRDRIAELEAASQSVKP